MKCSSRVCAAAYATASMGGDVRDLVEFLDVEPDDVLSLVRRAREGDEEGVAFMAALFVGLSAYVTARIFGFEPKVSFDAASKRCGYDCLEVYEVVIRTELVRFFKPVKRKRGGNGKET